MGSSLAGVVSQLLGSEPVKAAAAGAQALNSDVQTVETSTSTLKKVWLAVSPWVPWILLALGIGLAIFLGVLLFRWWRERRAPAAAAGGPPPMDANRLVQVRRTFLSGLPLINRAAVVDLPTVVVLGPAGGGKTQLIGLDVDWQRQARQFLPSYTADPLLQVYLGPDCVVHEVSAPLLEDETPQARTALRRMWSKCFSHRQKGLAVIALDVRWLADTPPEEQRRHAQLLRGKLNLMSEACGGPVETRMCLTHMDGLVGFEDFARLLKKHGVALAFDIPQQGEDGNLSSLLTGQEQYLALGLTSLPVESFERLERFYSEGGKSFSGLGRFVTSLLEGDTLSFKPRLSRVYLSSLTPEARASGTLSVATEAGATEALRRRYLRTHLQRAALVAAVGCLPTLLAYGRFYFLLSEAQGQVETIEQTVQQLRQQGLEGGGVAVEGLVNGAADELLRLDRVKKWWPPLESSFPREMLQLRQRLASGIRDSQLRPALEHCHSQLQDCRPEQVVYLLATLHASNQDGLGNFVRASLQSQPARRPEPKDASAPGAAPAASASSSSSRTWISALGLNETLMSTYILASDEPWERSPPCRQGINIQLSGTEEVWSCWPYAERLTFESQLKPWVDHFQLLVRDLKLGPDGLRELDQHREERERLMAQLADLDLYAALPNVLNLFDASKVQVNTQYFQGIQSTVEVLDWLRTNRPQLEAILHMEEEAYAGLIAVEKMSASELLVREGLWLITASNKGPYNLVLLQQKFDFEPPKHSRELLKRILDDRQANQMITGSAQPALLSPRDRSAFDSDLKPLVDDFTQRLKNAQLSTEESSRRAEYIKKRVDAFSQAYRDGLFSTVKQYRFDASSKGLLVALAQLAQPSSIQVDMLRDVANRANLEPLEGPYYAPLRNAVAPFQPIVQLMKSDQAGVYLALGPYHTLLAQMRDELDSVTKAAPKAPAGGGEAPKGDKAADKAADKSKGPDGADSAPDGTEFLSPLEKVALAMLLEEEGSYLRKAQTWLDAQGITGELRQPFLDPFLLVQKLGKNELESNLARQWEDGSGRLLKPLLTRYPFSPYSKEDVDPGELEVLRRNDGAFWHFVEQVYSRVCVERGGQWSLRSSLREKLLLPDALLPTLNQVGRLSKLLWAEDGRPRPLMLKVQPQPLPPSPIPGVFITMSSLKCGKTTAYGFNQSPAWQEFPLNWWDQQVSSIVLEVRSPTRDIPQYLSLPWNRSVWSCFRLFEEALVTTDQRRQWSLVLEGTKESRRGVEIGFGLKGDPWVPFREVPR